MSSAFTRPCGLRRTSAVGWPMGLRIRILLMAWMFISCVCCVLCRYQPLRRADHSFRGVLPYVCVCVVGTSATRRRRPESCCCVTDKKIILISSLTICNKFLLLFHLQRFLVSFSLLHTTLKLSKTDVVLWLLTFFLSAIRKLSSRAESFRSTLKKMDFCQKRQNIFTVLKAIQNSSTKFLISGA